MARGNECNAYWACNMEVDRQVQHVYRVFDVNNIYGTQYRPTSELADAIPHRIARCTVPQIWLLQCMSDTCCTYKVPTARGVQNMYIDTAPSA